MAATYQGYQTPQQWARTFATTLPKYIRDVEMDCVRSVKMLAMVEAEGNVLYNQGGAGFDWPIQFQFAPVQGFAGEGTNTYPAVNLWTQAALPYRGFIAMDSITEIDQLGNRGEEAIVKVANGMEARLKTGMQQALSFSCFKNGEAANNLQGWHGLNTMMGVDGTISIVDGQQRSYNAADPFFWPSATYAQLNTGLTVEQGGDIPTGGAQNFWPYGFTSTQADFWTPIIANYESTYWNNTPGWSSVWQDLLTQVFLNVGRNDLDAQPDLCLLARGLYGQAARTQESKERVIVNGPSGLRRLGFKDVFDYNNVEITAETAINQPVGYVLSLKSTGLMCMYPNLFKTEGPEFDGINDNSTKCAVKTLSNLKFKSPRNFAMVRPQTVDLNA